jgi:hypothetical protein
MVLIQIQRRERKCRRILGKKINEGLQENSKSHVVGVTTTFTKKRVERKVELEMGRKVIFKWD